MAHITQSWPINVPIYVVGSLASYQDRGHSDPHTEDCALRILDFCDVASSALCDALMLPLPSLNVTPPLPPPLQSAADVAAAAAAAEPFNV
jgi:hypothetical protein